MIKLYWLSQIESAHRPVVGEKAWLLSQLKQSDYPVLPGFVISAVTFQEFLHNLNDATSLLADFPTSSVHLDVDNPRALQIVAQQSRQAIFNAPLPIQWQNSLGEALEQLQTSALILRTSIAIPFPLDQEFSGLAPAQVCWNHPQAFELAIKKIWAQLLSARSLFYWQRLGIRINQLNLAILVQPLSNSLVSGITLAHPKTWEIQATWGLGHSLLQGEVLPDRFEIDPTTGEVTYQKLGNKTRAYRLKSSPDPQKITENCLEAYLLSAEQQTQYCLDSPSLSQLSQLMTRLTQEQFSWGSLEWMLTETNPPQLAIAQLKLPVPTPSSSLLSSPQSPINLTSPHLLKGIGASPGRIQALTYILTPETIPNPSLLCGHIIVTQQIHPFQLSFLKQAAGVITEQGGMTNHAAILARELGIPAVVGVWEATTLLKNEEFITLDGNTGEIYRELASQEKINPHRTLVIKETPPRLNYPIATQLMVNLSQSNSLTKFTDLPIDGLGLLRSELMFLDLCTPHPLEQWLTKSDPADIIKQLVSHIRQFAESFAPKPIFYRSFDEKSPEERRGVAGYRIDSSLFEMELQALSQVQSEGYGNLNLILPFVRSVEEFRFCHHLVEKAQLRLSDSFQLWIMAEVPSVIFELPQYVQVGVQGIAIGTNDLAPLLLGINRDHPQFNDASEPCSPALLSAMKQLIQQARTLDIPCSVCGQIIVQHPEVIESLVQWGITTISVEPEGVSKTYQAIARAEQRLILELARERLLARNS